MMRIVGQIADEFEVDRLRVQAVTLEGFSRKATTEEQLGALVRSSSPVIDEALATGRLDLADSLSAAVYRACQAAAGRAFRVETLNRRRKVQEQRGQWDEVQAARVRDRTPGSQRQFTLLADEDLVAAAVGLDHHREGRVLVGSDLLQRIEDDQDAHR